MNRFILSIRLFDTSPLKRKIEYKASLAKTGEVPKQKRKIKAFVESFTTHAPVQ